MRKFMVLVFTLIALTLVVPQVMAFTPTERPTLIAVDQANKAITFSAVVTAKTWQDYVNPVARDAEKGFDPDHWHLIIAGTQSNPAINRLPMFVSWATDVDIDKALASVGAKGEKFDKRTYYDHKDKESPFPDMKPKGTPISVYITWKDSLGLDKTIDVNDAITNNKGKMLKPVYLGKQHPSHCVICMYSCVGGICANESLTVKDYFDRGAEWKLVEGVLPKDGTLVLITLKLAG